MFGRVSTKNLYMCELQKGNDTMYTIATRLSDYIYEDYYSKELYYYANRFLDENEVFVIYSSPIFLTKMFVKEKDIQALLDRYNNQSKLIKRRVK